MLASVMPPPPPLPPTSERFCCPPPLSTDVEDPPTFTQSRHAATLPDHVQAAVRQHYSDLSPLTVPGTEVAAVLAAARRAATAALPRASVVREDGAAGQLELLDVTPLLRFKDDVAVRCAGSLGGDEWVAA